MQDWKTIQNCSRNVTAVSVDPSYKRVINVWNALPDVSGDLNSVIRLSTS